MVVGVGVRVGWGLRSKWSNEEFRPNTRSFWGVRRARVGVVGVGVGLRVGLGVGVGLRVGVRFRLMDALAE